MSLARAKGSSGRLSPLLLDAPPSVSQRARDLADGLWPLSDLSVMTLICVRQMPHSRAVKTADFHTDPLPARRPRGGAGSRSPSGCHTAVDASLVVDWSRSRPRCSRSRQAMNERPSGIVTVQYIVPALGHEFEALIFAPSERHAETAPKGRPRPHHRVVRSDGPSTRRPRRAEPEASRGHIWPRPASPDRPCR
jgi:hypothetical protein